MLDSHISSGQEGRKTPPGDFRAGPVKSPMHRSRLYDNAPMPWSVQVHENIFIHGFRKVPRHPASHGCIRLTHNFASELWSMTRMGVRVVVAPEDVQAVELAHPALPSPTLTPAPQPVAGGAGAAT